MAEYSTLLIERDGDVAHCILNRPEVRNAINPEMISDLRQFFHEELRETPARVVVLRGSADFFCSGADLNWMREAAGYGAKENMADARRLAGMLSAINHCPAYVIAAISGGAFGGGLGLAACCDTVICADSALFSLSEVRFGLSPATISPYVAAKIGHSHARSLMLSARRFDAQHAASIGLAHQVVSAAELEAAVASEIALALHCGPQAVAATKLLLSELQGKVSEALTERTAQLIADLRASDEGKEGLGAFADKRRPSWQPAE